jgi:8-oxo-dGTP pyrophosphatase MutT (NUDIX family)
MLLCDSANTCKNADMGPARQVAALPIRREPDGSVRVLLVTSRETKRWVIPKGWPWPDCEDCEAAAQEAREEAGVLGGIQPQPLGSFIYEKRRSSGPELVRADVYVIEVAPLLDSWPEQAERERAWFSLQHAADAVSDHELRELLRGFELDRIHFLSAKTAKPHEQTSPRVYQFTGFR